MRPFVFPILLLLVWEAAGRSGPFGSELLSTPTEVVVAAARALGDGSLLQATVQTLTAAIVGLAIGALIGIAIGTMLGLSALASDLAQVTLEVLRPIPSVALIPIAMLAFGFGYAMTISIVAFACLWPTLIITQAAVAQVPLQTLEVARVLELGLVARLRKIILPSILPRLFVGIRLAAGIALVVAVTVEITANPLGLGYALVVSQETLQPARMFAFLLWVGLLGWIVNAGLVLAQDRLFRRWTVAP